MRGEQACLGRGADGSGVGDFDESGGNLKWKEFLSNYILDAFPSNALLAISKNGEEISVLKLILYSLTIEKNSQI